VLTRTREPAAAYRTTLHRVIDSFDTQAVTRARSHATRQALRLCTWAFQLTCPTAFRLFGFSALRLFGFSAFRLFGF
jgi:hypothetical protein